MGDTTDGNFLWYIWYVLNLKQKVMVVIQGDTLTGWHGPRVYIILYGGKVWQSMVEVRKFGRLQKSKQRLVVDAKGIYILQYSMMMMLQMPELPFTSAQFCAHFPISHECYAGPHLFAHPKKSENTARSAYLV